MSKKIRFEKRPTTNKNKTKKKQHTSAEVSELDGNLAPLMPELEELVKKNPNRLIGCGG